MRVLIVDDDVTILDGLEMLLPDELPEAEVTTALDGASALRLIGLGTGFDVIVSDLGLPDMWGDELARTVRDRWGDSAVFGCMSGGGRVEEDVFDFALQKPFEIEELVQAIRDALARRR